MGSGLWPGLPLPTPNEPDPVDLAQVQVRVCVGFAGHLNAPYDGGQRMARVATSEGFHSRLEGMLHLKNSVSYAQLYWGVRRMGCWGKNLEGFYVVYERLRESQSSPILTTHIPQVWGAMVIIITFCVII